MSEQHDAGCEITLDGGDFEQAMDAFKAEEETFKAKHPQACSACGGTGGHVSYYDPSPPGIGLSPGFMQDWDPCTECVEQGRCPLCGGECVFDEAQNADTCRAPECGWRSDGEFDSMPEAPWPPSCTCEPDWDAV